MTGATLSRTAREAKIVGGSFAERGEFPHQVSLTYHDEFQCGGSILSSLLVLTAAHCVKYKRPNRLKIHAGEHDRSLPSYGSGSEQIRTARYIYMHEQYVWETDVNDIALIVLSSPLQYTPHVQNISLPRDGEEFDGYATVTGWGRTKEKGEVSSTLKKVTLPIVPHEVCKRRYSIVRMKVTDNMLCAGETGQDACQGDSGGPAICRRRGSRAGTRAEWVQCGVVSHGYGCGRSGYPGVYTKVANYISWIEETQRKIVARGKCRTDHFYCSSGPGCIPRAFLCDLEADCQGEDDAEDERGCIQMTSCRRNQFRCNNGRCIKQEYTCDEMDDCGDRSDEDKCPTESKTCSSNEHQCGPAGRCIPEEWKCDNEQDCDDNSDETGCSRNNGTISSAENEIGDGSLEKENKTSLSKPSPCSESQFYCSRDFRCIPLAWRCDGDRDCRSGIDEIGCSNDNDGDNTTATGVEATTVSTTSQSVASEQEPAAATTITPLPSTSSSPPPSGVDSDVLSSINPGSTPNPMNFSTSTGLCSRSQFRCNSGQCISNLFQCDFDEDCEDGSDENDCPLVEPTCSPYFWRCSNAQCIYHKFRCDGDIDCTDGSDEQSCNNETNAITARRKTRRG